MDKIKYLFSKIDDELLDAMEYAKDAAENKDTDPALSEMLYSLSLEEMKHKSGLHNQVVKAMENCIAKHPEKEEAVRAVYEALNERTIEWENSVRVYQAMYRE